MAQSWGQEALQVRMRSADELLAVLANPRTWTEQASELPKDDLGDEMRRRLRQLGDDGL